MNKWKPPDPFNCEAFGQPTESHTPETRLSNTGLRKLANDAATGVSVKALVKPKNAILVISYQGVPNTLPRTSI